MAKKLIIERILTSAGFASLMILVIVSMEVRTLSLRFNTPSQHSRQSPIRTGNIARQNIYKSDENSSPISFSPVDTSNWKIYKNATYGWLIQYPPDYKIGSCTNCTDLHTTDFVDFSPPHDEGYGSIMVAKIIGKSLEQSADGYLQEIAGLDDNSVVVNSVKRFSLHGLQALMVTKSGSWHETIYVFLASAGKGFKITFAGVYSGTANDNVPAEQLQNEKVFEQMLSTFRLALY